VELSDALAEGDPVVVAVVVALSIDVPEAAPVVVALTVPLPVELCDAVADGDPVAVATTLSDDWGEPDETGEEEPDSLRTELCDAATEEDRVTRGDDDTVADSVFVFELVKDCDGLDECVGVLDCVDDLLTDAETLGDLLEAPLRV
jgi:hypothetical protein